MRSTPPTANSLLGGTWVGTCAAPAAGMYTSANCTQCWVWCFTFLRHGLGRAGQGVVGVELPVLRVWWGHENRLHGNLSMPAAKQQTPPRLRAVELPKNRARRPGSSAVPHTHGFFSPTRQTTKATPAAEKRSTIAAQRHRPSRRRGGAAQGGETGGTAAPVVHGCIVRVLASWYYLYSSRLYELRRVLVYISYCIILLEYSSTVQFLVYTRTRIEYSRSTTRSVKLPSILRGW